jgi:hypothetical protein
VKSVPARPEVYTERLSEGVSTGMIPTIDSLPWITIPCIVANLIFLCRVFGLSNCPQYAKVVQRQVR